MIHAKFQDNRTSGFGEEFLRSFTYKGIMRPFWSCDLDNYENFHSPFPMRLHIKFMFDWPSGFRREDVGKPEDLWSCKRSPDILA